MMQHAVDPWSFARPPPPGFLFRHGSSCACQAVADVPAQPRPPPPGFSRPRRVLPPSPRELPVQPKLPKREALPVSRAAAQKDHSIKRQRLCSDYEHDIDANLRATEKNAEERLRPDYLKTVQQDQVSASARASLVGWMDAFVGATASLTACRLPRPRPVGAGHEHAQRLRALPPGRHGRLCRCQVRGPAHRAGARRPQDRQLWRVRHGQGGARHGAPHSGGARVPARRPHGAHVRRPLHKAREGEEELKIQRMAHRLADLSLLNYACVGYLPSVVAASAIFLARFGLNSTHRTYCRGARRCRISRGITSWTWLPA